MQLVEIFHSKQSFQVKNSINSERS